MWMESKAVRSRSGLNSKPLTVNWKDTFCPTGILSVDGASDWTAHSVLTATPPGLLIWYAKSAVTSRLPMLTIVAVNVRSHCR